MWDLRISSLYNDGWIYQKGKYMTEKELRKLNRAELIEILYYLSRANDELKEENEHLKARLDALVGEAIASKRQGAAEDAVSEEHEGMESAEV